MKTLLFHDTFLTKWWAERMNIEIAKILGADIATAIWAKGSYDRDIPWYHWRILETNKRFRRGMLGFLIMKFSFFFSRKITKNYNTILFSNEAISAIWLTPKEVRTYYYAHSISRHLFDLSDEYLAKVPWMIRPLYRLFAWILRKIFIWELHKVGTIFVNSEKNKVRMREWIGRDDAIVLSPPVDTKKFKKYDENTLSQTLAIEWIYWSYKDYYISFSRLTHVKRVDHIIQVFAKIPNKKIIILYGENDGQKNEFLELWRWYQNIVFHCLKNNEHLPIVLSWAIASIAISREEDFGMVAIESMACGVPVIAVDEWGYKETIIDSKTGILLKLKDTALEENNTKNLELIENLKICIEHTSNDKFSKMEDACQRQAENYSFENFEKKLISYFNV